MRGDNNNNRDDSSKVNVDDYRLPISYGALDLDNEDDEASEMDSRPFQPCIDHRHYR